MLMDTKDDIKSSTENFSQDTGDCGGSLPILPNWESRPKYIKRVLLCFKN